MEASKDNLLSNIRDNWKFFVVIFLMGMAYSENESQKQKFNNLSERVDKKIQVIYENSKEIRALEFNQIKLQGEEKMVLYRLKKLEDEHKSK